VEKIADLTQWSIFWGTFRLPILVSLLGALIGHYSKNGVIQLPLFVILYSKSYWVQNISDKIPWLLIKLIALPVFIIIDFLSFLMGVRFDEEQSGKRIYLELGFLGDILIGIGTGILAKTAIELANTENIYAEVSTAFIAGFLGLSYIKERQRRDLGIDKPEDRNVHLDPSKIAEPMNHSFESEESARRETKLTKTALDNSSPEKL
jgi:hypothetical protein